VKRSFVVQHENFAGSPLLTFTNAIKLKQP
jgi:hypothetical protein